MDDDVRPPGSTGYTTPLSVDAQALQESHGPIARFLIFCSGADRKLLARGGTETATYVGLGGTVMATAALAFVSSTFFLSLAFNRPLWQIVPISMMWGLIIFNLDRWLLASYRKLSNQVLTFVSLVPRLLLAAMIGFLIAEPMVLEIFRAEIAEELRDVEEQTRQQRLETITTGPESRQIEVKRLEIAGLESRLGQSDDAEIAEFQGEIDEQRALVDGWEDELAVSRTALLQSQASLEEEVVDGCLDGGEDCAPGRGPIARQKEREVELRQDEFDAVEANLNPRIAESTDRITQLQELIDTRRQELSTQLTEADDEINQQIGTLRSEIDDIEGLMDDLRSGVNDGETEYGILARIEALDTLREENGSINRLYWLLTLFFIAIDTIPILGKWFMGLGEPRPYELLRDAKERAVKSQVSQIIARHDLDEQVQDSASSYLAGAQAANDQHLINHWAAINRNLGQTQLGSWERSVAPPGYQQIAVEALPPVGITAALPEAKSRLGAGGQKTSRAIATAGAVVLTLALVGLGWFVWSNLFGGDSEETATVAGAEVDEGPLGQPTPSSSVLTSPEVAAPTTTASSSEEDLEADPATSTTLAPSTTAPRSANALADLEAADLSQLDALQALVGEPDATRPRYDRDAFDEGQDLDGDCIRTRHEVLIEEGQDVQISGCKVAGGVWNDGYTGMTITDPNELQVDHVVSLNDAWDSGAWAFNAADRRRFSNSPSNLNAIYGPENERKGNLGPADYSPRRSEQTCSYLEQYAAVKIDWGLSITSADYDAVAQGLSGCGDRTIAPLFGGTSQTTQAITTTSTAAPTTASTSTTSTTTTSTNSDCHPSYTPCLPRGRDLDCGELSSSQKPVTVNGSDPYRLDADNDGIGCELG